MHDLKYIRENPEEFDAKLARRNIEPLSSQVLELDKEWREGETKLQTAQQELNAVSKQIGQTRAQGGDAADLMNQATVLKTEITRLQTAPNAALELLAGTANLLADDVPDGKDESENVEIRKWGEPKKFDFKPKAHDDLAEKLGWVDFERTAKISGSRFATLKGPLAKLERKLADMMLDQHIEEYGFEEMRPPHLVWDKALFGTGQLPKFKEDLFVTEGEHSLIPTAEVTLTNMAAEQIFEVDALPLRYTAFTQCFRSEAGSAGQDTKGMIRMHEFSKVEMVAITKPEDSEAEHERLLEQAEKILQKLNLPYRVMMLCSGDTGFSARKTYDLEVWLPSQDAYREISSISNCGDFQTRRMKARFRPVKGDKKTEFLHTLNGSGLAIGRTIVAILENYQNEDGTVTLPKL